MKIIKTFSIILVSLFLTSCSEDDLQEMKYRNPNFIWFVPEGDLLGQWIEIDYTKESEILTSGHCTTFYENGNERSFYILDQRGIKDTTFYFDLDKNITHYSTGIEEQVQNYFYNEGKFKSFLADGSLAISGIVNDHDLIDYEWHGAMADFQVLISSKKQVWADYLELGDNIFSAIQERTESGASHIPKERIDSIDSLRISILHSTTGTSELLNNIKVAKVSEKLKENYVGLVYNIKMMLEDDCKKFIKSLNLEFTPENIETMRSLAKSYDEKNSELEKNNHDDILTWIRQTKPGEYTMPYMAEYLTKKYR